MIRFIEHESPGYTGRTLRNTSSAKVTIAFAFDFNTAGEKLTKSLAEKFGPYLKVDLNFDSEEKIYRSLSDVILKLKLLNIENLSINIAGNGIYTLNKYENTHQADIDSFIYEYVKGLSNRFEIKQILSGGQTGVDEAGLKAGDRLGICTVCNFPKDWLFRDIRGNDIRDRVKFLQRFGAIYPELY